VPPVPLRGQRQMLAVAQVILRQDNSSGTYNNQKASAITLPGIIEGTDAIGILVANISFQLCQREV
jgi:hypothetical protein